MNTDENRFLIKYKYQLSIFLLLAIIIVIPALLEYLFFQNRIYSVLTNGEWASFFGSYIGGIIGGVGTLAAVAITTKETRKIQKDAVDYQNDLLKKEFKSKIVEIVSTYIADIEKYYDGQIKNQKVDCVIANRSINELKIYLDGKDEAKKMLELMELIEDTKSMKNGSDEEVKKFYENTDHLLKLCAEFVKNCNSSVNDTKDS